MRRYCIVGTAGLFLAIAIGVSAAESQVNDLTRESDFVRTLNIRRDAKSEDATLYVLGETVALGRWRYADAQIAAAHAKEYYGLALGEMAIWRKSAEKYYEIVREDLESYF